MDKLTAMRDYFEAMVTYRTTSIISTLTRLQMLLLINKDKLKPEEMDAEINRLEDVRRMLENDVSCVTKSTKNIP